MGIRNRCDYIPVYTDGSWGWEFCGLRYVQVFPSDTVISTRLPDSASIFTAEMCAIIKALEQIKDSIASKYIISTHSLSCL